MPTVKPPVSKLHDDNVLHFILGGRAIFTIRNAANGNRFTYKVETPDDVEPEDSEIFFVRLLTGSNNEEDYQYLGCIRIQDGHPVFQHGRKSRISAEAPGTVAFAYCFNVLLAHNRTHKDLEIWHEGRCCRCGRTLTVPESIASGIGPDCATKASKKRKPVTSNLQIA